MLNPCAKGFADARDNGVFFKLIRNIFCSERTASGIAVHVEKALLCADLVSLENKGRGWGEIDILLEQINK